MDWSFPFTMFFVFAQMALNVWFGRQLCKALDANESAPHVFRAYWNNKLYMMMDKKLYLVEVREEVGEQCNEKEISGIA